MTLWTPGFMRPAVVRACARALAAASFLFLLNAFVQSEGIQADEVLIGVAWLALCWLLSARCPVAPVLVLTFFAGVAWGLFLESRPVSDWRWFHGYARDLVQGDHYALFHTKSFTTTVYQAFFHALPWSEWLANYVAAALAWTAGAAFVYAALLPFSGDRRLARFVCFALALCPTFLASAPTLGSEAVFFLVSALCVWLLSRHVRYRDGPRAWRYPLALGTALGLLYLTRPHGALLLAVCLPVVALVGPARRAGSASPNLRAAALVLLAFTAVPLAYGSLNALFGYGEGFRFGSNHEGWIILMHGSNMESGGRHTGADALRIRADNASPAEADRRARETALRRIGADIPAFVNFAFTTKMFHLYGRDHQFFGWGVRGASPRTVQLDAELRPTVERVEMSVYRLVFLLFLALLAREIWRPGPLLLPGAIVLLYSLPHLAFEVHARYHILMLPWMVAGSALLLPSLARRDLPNLRLRPAALNHRLQTFDFTSLRLYGLLSARIPPSARHFLVSHSALLVCALFLLAGLAVLDDYGISPDAWIQREIGRSAAATIRGEVYPRTLRNADPYYGVAFELPLVWAEQLPGLGGDSRSVYLGRHLLTHLFFLAGGYFCSRLVHQLFNSRLLALFALLLFLLQPRLYAHSFFNSKDVPFLSMFMIALYLLQRAFRRDTLRAFLLCGVGVGLLMNIRAPGLLLFLAVPALRALDLRFATGRAERRHILTSAGVFALAAPLTLYLTWPLLWGDPLRFFEALRAMAAHPNLTQNLFQGVLIPGQAVPLHYIPTWIAITTPPVVLLLLLIGAGVVLHGGLRAPATLLRNTRLRFGLLLIALLVLPVLTVFVLRSNLYNGWRQLYFLYAPLCLLAVFGLHCLVARPGRVLLRAAACTLTALALTATVAQMISVHPHQYVWFNFLVDRNTPEYLRRQYDLDYWSISLWEATETLLARYPSRQLYVHYNANPSVRPISLLLLPGAGQQRVITDDERVDFYIDNGDARLPPGALPPDALYRRGKVFNSTLYTITERSPAPQQDEAVAALWRNKYRAVTANEPLMRSDFDLYLDGRTLTWVRESCTPADTRGRFSLHVFPADPADLNAARRAYGFRNMNFSFVKFGQLFDDRCMAQRQLPWYDIARIRAGQWIPGRGPSLWSAEAPVPERLVHVEIPPTTPMWLHEQFMRDIYS